ncbi:MAG TPA: preprotein translocase subunit YajC [Flavobacteriales bacterium]|nr:preprotein translocase subunit YajC [Flavobacteriales bacterium]|tara:strand:- start:193 stop:525 length:333 start_codon:yes stop_codon:yes gene_type:complete
MLNLFARLTLQSAAPGEGGLSFFLLIGGMFLIMYLFMIRPQVKKQKEAKTFREGLKKGDKVVSIGGIHGKVIDMNERTVLMQIDGAKIRIDKTALNPAGEASEEDIKANT